jgi:hypothetical protein
MVRDRGARQRLSAIGQGKPPRRRVVGGASAVAGIMAATVVAIAGVAIAGLAIAGPAVLAAAGTAASAATAATASTKLTAVTALSCPSASHCWAGASDGRRTAIIATANGGDTWRVGYAGARFDDIVALDCTSAAHCLAIGDVAEGAGAAFLETSDGGAVWTVHAAPKSVALAGALSCSNGSDCWAVGLAGDRFKAAVARTTDGGLEWTSESIPALETAMSSPFGISCTSSTRCLVTGDASLTTTNGGKTWAKHAIPGGSPFGPVTCPSTKDCYAVFNVTSAVPSNEETFLYTSANGGVTWKKVLADPRHVAGLGGISCPSATTCVAVGNGYTPRGNGTDTFYGVSELTSTGGSHWAPSTTAKAQVLFADSCAEATRDCVAGGQTSAGAVLLKSANDGTTWTSEPLPKA